MGYSKWNYVKNSIKLNKRLIKNFGFSYGSKRMLLSLVPRKIREKNQLCIRIDEKCNCFAMDYLKKNYLSIIKEYKYQKSDNVIGENSNIWVFWWQGFDEAPDIVKNCIKSIQKNSGRHPVILLDKDNYKDYVAMPEYIMQKFKEGKITITHFSDLLRVSLLYLYGGIWMDATIYMTHPLEHTIEERSFYSINHRGESKGVVRLGQWTSFFLASGKGNSIIGLLKELMFGYWKREEELIVYLWIDYFLTMIYENVEQAREEIKSLPITNRQIFEMDTFLNQECETLKKLDGNTYLYKLTYKKNFLKNIDGKETVYYRLIKDLEK